MTCVVLSEMMPLDAWIFWNIPRSGWSPSGTTLADVCCFLNYTCGVKGLNSFSMMLPSRFSGALSIGLFNHTCLSQQTMKCGIRYCRFVECLKERSPPFRRKREATLLGQLTFRDCAGTFNDELCHRLTFGACASPEQSLLCVRDSKIQSSRFWIPRHGSHGHLTSYVHCMTKAGK